MPRWVLEVAGGFELPWAIAFLPDGRMLITEKHLFPEWKGNLFIAGLSSKALVRLVLDHDRVTGEERLLTNLDTRIREVTQGPEGALYVLTDGDNGKLLKLTPQQQN